MSTITRERAAKIAAGGGFNFDEVEELARIALAAQAAGPVYQWRERYEDSDLWDDCTKEQYEGFAKRPDVETRILYTAPPAPVSVPDYPETLPCSVMLEPGLRFGKGVPTKTMLGAMQRRAEYYAEIEAMTPEQRAQHDVGMKEFAAMLQGAEPVTTDTVQGIDMRDVDRFEVERLQEIISGSRLVATESKLLARFMLDAKQVLAAPQQEVK